MARCYGVSCFVVIVWAVLATCALGQTLSEDFDALSLGVFPPGWTLAYSGYGAQYQIVDSSEYTSAPHALKMEGATAYTAAAYLFLPYTTDYIRVEVDVLPTEVDVPSWGNHIASVNLGASDGPGVGTSLHFGPSYSGSRLWGGNGVYSHTTGPVYAQGVWHHVEITADFEHMIYSIYVDDAPFVVDAPMAGDYGYDVVALNGENSCHTRVWFDNLEIVWDQPAPVEAVSWTTIKSLYR